jgi:hypothetical protein
MAKPQAEKTRIVLSELNAAFGKLERTQKSCLSRDGR